MKVFIVAEGQWDERYEHGTFSTPEKAEAYITMVNEAEEIAGVNYGLRPVLQIEEVDVDAMAEVFPVYSVTGYLKSQDTSDLRISYLREVPQSRFFLTVDVFESPEEIYAAEGYGRTPEEAVTNLERALADAAAMQKVSA